MEAKQGRIRWADVAKGIGILLVVLGHVNVTPFIGKVWIYSYHMPLFFFLSGYFARPGKISVRRSITKSAKHLLLPYLLFSIVFLAADYFMVRLRPEEMRAEFLDFCTGRYIILWFFVSLFIVSVLFQIIHCIFQKKIYQNITIFCCAVLGFILDHYLPNQSFQIIPESLFVLGFYNIGYLIGKKPLQIQEKRLKVTSLMLAAFISLLGSAVIYKATHRMILNVKDGESYDFIITYIIALCGIYCVVGISKYLEMWSIAKPLNYIGRNSLYFFPLTYYIPFSVVDGLHINGNHSTSALIIKLGMVFVGFTVTVVVVTVKNRLKEHAQRRRTSL